jgi:hypothetical protein
MVSHYTATEIIRPDAVVFVNRFVSTSFLFLSLLFVHVLLDFHVQLPNRGPLILMLIPTVDFYFNPCRNMLGNNA